MTFHAGAVTVTNGRTWPEAITIALVTVFLRKCAQSEHHSHS